MSARRRPARAALARALPLLGALACSHVEEKAGVEVHLHLAEESLPDAISEASIGIASVELLPCAVAAAPMGWLIPVAHAHHPTTSTAGADLEAPTDLGQPGATLAVLGPPADRYCTLRAVVEPLGAEGQSLRLRRAAEPATELWSASVAWLDLPLSPPLNLDEDHLEAELSLSVGAARWEEAAAAAEQSGLSEPNALGDAVFVAMKGWAAVSAD